MLAHRGLVVGANVRGAVSEPEQVARRDLSARGRRGASEPELAEAHRRHSVGEPGEVADCVDGYLRVVRAGLDRDVTIRGVWVEVVVGEVREPLQCSGPA